MCLEYNSFENTIGKGEIVCIEQFLPSPQCFLPIWRIFYYFNQKWNCWPQFLSVWKSLKFFIWERVNSWTLTPKKDLTKNRYEIWQLYLSTIQKWWSTLKSFFFVDTDRETERQLQDKNYMHQIYQYRGIKMSQGWIPRNRKKNLSKKTILSGHFFLLDMLFSSEQNPVETVFNQLPDKKF